MAKCKVTLYVDIVSPFGYLAYYMLRVSRILRQCPLLPLIPSAIMLSFHPQAAPTSYVGVYSELLFVLVRHIGLFLALSQDPLRPLPFPVNSPNLFAFPLCTPEQRPI